MIYWLTDTRAGVEDDAEDCSGAAANGQSIHFLPRDIWRPWTWYSPFVGRNSWDIDPNNCCRLIISFCTILQKHSKEIVKTYFLFYFNLAVSVSSQHPCYGMLDTNINILMILIYELNIRGLGLEVSSNFLMSLVLLSYNWIFPNVVGMLIVYVL